MHISRYLFFIFFVAATLCSHAQDKPITDTLLISDSLVEAVEKAVTTKDEQDSDSSEQQENNNGKLVKTADSFSLRQVPDTVSEHLKKSKTFAYANDSSYWGKEEKKPLTKGFWDYFFDFVSSKAARVIFYILLILLTIFVLYRVIVTNNLFVFGSRRRNKKLAQEDEQNGIEDDNLDEKINASIIAQEYRVAVRYLYLKSLKLLNNKGWIRYSSESTNYDYVKQTGSFPIAKDFAYLTRAYEYVWYGEFEINNSQFDILFTNFKNLYSSIKI